MVKREQRYNTLKRKNFGNIGKQRADFKASNSAVVLRMICIVLGTVILLLGACALLIPPVGVFLGLREPPPADLSTNGDSGGPHATPSASLQPQETDYSYLQQELLLKHNDITVPCFYGNEFLFSTDDPKVKGIKHDQLIIFDLLKHQETLVGDAGIKYDNILEPHMNDRYIVYLDAAAQGGEIICIDRQSGEKRLVRALALGTPFLRLSGNLLCWIERTGVRQDKLFLCDLETMETVTLVVFVEDLYGTSAPGVSDKEVVYARSASEGTGNTSEIVSYDMTVPSPEMKVYKPNTYVHDPLTYENTRAWIDGNNAPDSTVYVSVDEGVPIEVVSGISDYALGKGFVAYCKDEVVWAYRFDRALYARLSGAQEKAMLAGVSEDRVMWFDVTDVMRENTILKYALIEKELGE